jgi:transcriptional regulator with XRE-family HTH domain
VDNLKEIKIGERIKKVRMQKGLSASYLAELTGLSQQYISLVENNKTTPSLKSLYKIASALESTPSILIDDNRWNDTPIFLYHILDEDLKSFLLREENIGYLKLAKEIKDKNISEDDMKALINILYKNK